MAQLTIEPYTGKEQPFDASLSSCPMDCIVMRYGPGFKSFPFSSVTCDIYGLLSTLRTAEPRTSKLSSKAKMLSRNFRLDSFGVITSILQGPGAMRT